MKGGGKGCSDRDPVGHRLAACRGKQRFASAVIAWRAIRSRRQGRRKATAAGLTKAKAYRCEFCGGFHIANDGREGK